MYAVVHELFNGISQPERWVEKAENLHVSPFTEDLSTYPTFERISLDMDSTVKLSWGILQILYKN